MSSPDKLGASGRNIELDLTTASFPLYFQPLFATKYPSDPTLQAQAVSRTIVAITGSGSITLIDTMSDANGDPVQSELTMAEGSYRSVQAVGVAARGDLSTIQVFL